MTMYDLDTSTAACAGADPDIFVLVSRENEAKNMCAACPIVAACLEATLQTEQCWGLKARGGIFGGLTAEERYAIDRQRWPDQRVGKPVNLVQRRAS